MDWRKLRLLVHGEDILRFMYLIFLYSEIVGYSSVKVMLLMRMMLSDWPHTRTKMGMLVDQDGADNVV